MSAEFTKLVGKMAPLFEKLMKQSPITVGEKAKLPKEPGVYLLSDEKGHLYAGRTKNIYNRIGNHGGTSPDSSTFAFKLASESIGRKVTYKKGEGRKDIRATEKFQTAFRENVALIRKMNVRYVIIEDDLTQHFFEAYVHMALKTPHNSFPNH